MVKTRRARKSSSARRKSRRRSLKRSYRRHVKASSCKGKRARTCNKSSGCKLATGKKRSFCRKTRNTRHRRR